MEKDGSGSEKSYIDIESDDDSEDCVSEFLNILIKENFTMTTKYNTMLSTPTGPTVKSNIMQCKNVGDDSGFILPEDSESSFIGENSKDAEIVGEMTNSANSSNSDLQPTRGLPEPEPISVSPLQRCLFCPSTFQLEQEFITHLDTCNASIIKRIICPRKKQCLICRKRIASFSICGLIRHSITCIIEERENLLIMQEQLNQSNYQIKDEELPAESTNEEKYTPTSGRFSKDQVFALKTFFKTERFPNFKKVEKLARSVRLTPEQIKSWFYRQRISRLYWNNGKSSLRSNKRKSKDNKMFGRKMNNSNDSHSNILYSFFKKNMYPNLEEKKKLARKTGLNLQQIKDWFANRKKRIPYIKRVRSVSADETISYSSNKRSQFHAACEKIRETVEYMKYKSPRFLNYTKEVVEILEESFQCNAFPGGLQLIELSSLTNLSVKQIQKWMSHRRNSTTHKKSKSYSSVSDGPTNVTLTSRSSQEDEKVLDEEKAFNFEHIPEETVNQPSVDHDEYEFEEDDPFLVPEVLLKDQPIRRKFADIKKINAEIFKSYLASIRPLISILLEKYADIGESSKKNITTESAILARAFQLNNPFSPMQIDEINNWEEDIVHSLYPERVGAEWIHLVNLFQVQVLKSWLPLLIYSRILNVSLKEAAIEIYHNIYLGRNEKPTVKSWTVPAMLY